MATVKPKVKGKKAKKVVKKVEAPRPQTAFLTGLTAPPTHPSLLQAQPSNTYIRIELQFLEWALPTWTIMVSPSTPLLSIAQRIEARHGTLNSLNLYQSPPSSETQIHDFSLTIGSFGWKCDPRSFLPSYTIYYDFIPTFRTALVMKEPINYLAALNRNYRNTGVSNGRAATAQVGHRPKELQIPDTKKSPRPDSMSSAGHSTSSSISSYPISTPTSHLQTEESKGFAS